MAYVAPFAPTTVEFPDADLGMPSPPKEASPLEKTQDVVSGPDLSYEFVPTIGRKSDRSR